MIKETTAINSRISHSAFQFPYPGNWELQLRFKTILILLAINGATVIKK